MFVWHCNNQKAILKCHKLSIQNVFEFERQHVSEESNKLPVGFFIFIKTLTCLRDDPADTMPTARPCSSMDIRAIINF